MHCAETRAQAIESRAAESALWFLKRGAQRFPRPTRRVDRLDSGGCRQQRSPGPPRSVDPSEVQGEIDLNDPVPVIRLLNRQLAGETVDGEEAFEVLEAIESVVIGDVDACRTKIRAYQDLGIDRLMGLMSFGYLSQEDTLRSIRLTGEQLIPRIFARRDLEGCSCAGLNTVGAPNRSGVSRRAGKARRAKPAPQLPLEPRAGRDWRASRSRAEDRSGSPDALVLASEHLGKLDPHRA